jgi:isocitrate dehydrogenase
MALFEAIHGSAPDIAGKGVANPSGLLKAGVMMLVHIGQPEVAERVHNAYLATIESGIHTGDIYNPSISKARVGTEAFADAIIKRLGETPKILKPVSYAAGVGMPQPTHAIHRTPAQRTLYGIDVFLQWDGEPRDPDVLGAALEPASTNALKLTMMTNRGLKVWPNGAPETFCTDHWRCRFEPRDGASVSQQDVLSLLQSVHDRGFDIIKTEHLYLFDGKPGFALGQGQ